MIEIMSLRLDKMVYKNDVRVDRKSIVGNPFVGERNEACDKYDKYFGEKLNSNDKKFNEYIGFLERVLKKYGRIRLFCWCAPKRCHAETIKRYLESVM